MISAEKSSSTVGSVPATGLDMAFQAAMDPACVARARLPRIAGQDTYTRSGYTEAPSGSLMVEGTA